MQTSPAITPGQMVTLTLDTLERQAKALTPKQASELRRAAENRLGVVILEDGRRGLRKSGWERMMGRLAAQGLVRPYVHGGFEITDAGRKVLTILSERH